MVIAFLVLAQLAETVTVTATRTETRVGETPASVVVLSREELQSSAAPVLDDALRQVAGFTLFRRSGSRVANPTAQGVTLRGVGASGASRALVLDDGVPLNDPFGGWVHWGRVPVVALERVEVLRGGASDLYGSSAMGGVIQFVRRKTPVQAIDASAGSHGTGAASLYLAGDTFSLAADLFTTNGFQQVKRGQRGAVDVEANSRHAAIDGTWRMEHAFVRASSYKESRANGTPLQQNETSIWQVAFGGDLALSGGALTLRGSASDHDYDQTFSAVAEDRESERLTVEQRVPSQGAGGALQWTRAFGARTVLVTGAEVRRAGGRSDEMRFTPAGSFAVSSGGVQRTVGAFAEGLISLSPAVSVTAGVRLDGWENESNDGGERSEGQWNPRLAVLWRLRDALTLSASAYSAFRAPTLNELYRGFRVGNVNTLPNAGLQAETLRGVEVGARFGRARLTLFSMQVDGAIANVTLLQTPGLITRQRQNLGVTRSRGAELDAAWSAGDWRVSGSWLFVDARVREGELRGHRVPQVPGHQATAQLAWKSISVLGRWSGMQFDDDRNQLPLAAFFVVDVAIAHPLRGGLDATMAVENVLDEAVEVSATPVVTLGQPRAFRLGLRYRS